MLRVRRLQPARHRAVDRERALAASGHQHAPERRASGRRACATRALRSGVGGTIGLPVSNTCVRVPNRSSLPRLGQTEVDVSHPAAEPPGGEPGIGVLLLDRGRKARRGPRARPRAPRRSRRCRAPQPDARPRAARPHRAAAGPRAAASGRSSTSAAGRSARRAAGDSGSPGSEGSWPPPRGPRPPGPARVRSAAPRSPQRWRAPASGAHRCHRRR